MPQATPAVTVEQVIALRRQRLVGKQSARTLKLSPATVSRILQRVRLSRARDLDPPAPVRRYERDHSGELIRIDIRKVGRFASIGHRITGDRTRQSNPRARGEGAGREIVHICIDDASRLAFSQVLPDENAASAVPFLHAAVAYYKSLAISVTRVMTDNGSCYKSFAFGDAREALGLKHIRTRPYTPKTNGTAERFVQTTFARMPMPAHIQCRNTARLPRTLAPQLQLASTPRQPTVHAAHQPTQPADEQPAEAPQLAGWMGDNIYHQVGGSCSPSPHCSG